MTYPQQPQQPYGRPFPPPPKKNTGKIIGFGCLGLVVAFVLLAVVIAAVAGSGEDSGAGSSGARDSAAKENRPARDEAAEGEAAEGEAAEREATDGEPEQSAADQFKDCVADSGSEAEKSAVEHVTKVDGVDRRNDILDSAEVFTDFTGGIAGPDGGEAKLIASAFASCYESDNGLVTVYGEDGDMIANGNY